ncbi:putative bifunctional diguanylate cyclase/phosphodiesterase [Congregibacter sp.]|uniref:putative bifunctional diguanylate cyclase/phosphodiesterase n=1 Tax=Congregibacter sp. TaxID=2744308 RepID=UPI003F6D6E53
MTSPDSQPASSSNYVTSHVCEDLYRQTPVSSAVILFIIAVFWIALRGQSDTTLLNVWAATLTATAAIRYFIWYLRHSSPQRFSDQTWLKIYSASCILVGSSWSLIFLSVSDWSNLATLAAPWMLMLGVLSSASIALGQHIPTFVLYTAPPVLISGVLMLFRSIDTLGWLLVAYWAYYLILLGFTRATNRTYLARLALAAENQSLLDALQAQTSGQEAIIATRTSELRDSNKDLAEQMSRRQELERLAQKDLALLGSVINSTSDFIFYKDYSESKGRYLGCNNAFAEFLGLAPEDIIGKTDEDLCDAEEAEIRRQADESALRDGKKVIERWVHHPAGHRVLLSASLNVFRDEQGTVRGIVSIARDITEQKKAEETLRYQQRSLEHLAHHDALTGLPNRLYLIDKLNHALQNPDKQASSLAVLFLDLDHFKDINDSLGHSLGDEVLRAVSRRLSDCVRRADIIARLGGDEFTIVLQGVGSSVTALEVAQKILLAFQQPLILEERKLTVGTSIGISVSPGDGQTTEELLRNADAAMYRAKHSGRNTFMHYTPDMTERALARLSLESDMHSALERREFHVAYQPQVDMRSGALIGVEALLRWDHPSKSAISPEHFIPIAEENGQILALGKWVLQEVCAEQKRLANADLRGIRFAVNVSGRQLLHESFIELIQEIIELDACQSDALELEITESVLLTEPELASKAMQAIRKLGIAISVDDFGTGYSSLAYLKQYPLSRLKIDASFVRDIVIDPGDRAIAQTIIALGNALNLEVIAEGVETEEQREMLISDGCHLGQGFLFSRPLTPAALLEYSRRGVKAS